MRAVVLTAIAVLAVSAGVFAQTTDPVEKALLGAPGNLRKDATVIRWKADFTYDTLKQGTNKLVCYDMSGMPGERPFSVECTSTANLARVSQNLKFHKMAGSDANKMKELVEAAGKDRTRVASQAGSIWYNFRGNDEKSANRHSTIALPGATSASTGLPDKGDQGGAWVMAAGTAEAHIMVPGR